MNSENVLETETDNDETGPVIITKISVATIGARPTRVQNESIEYETLARIGGIARSVFVKANKTTGESSVGIAGDFIALSLKTGKTYQSGVVYLPSGIQEQITSALSDGASSIEFMIELRAVKATNPIGYSYQAISLHRPIKSDPLSHLKRFIAVKPQLTVVKDNLANAKDKATHVQVDQPLIFP